MEGRCRCERIARRRVVTMISGIMLKYCTTMPEDSALEDYGTMLGNCQAMSMLEKCKTMSSRKNGKGDIGVGELQSDEDIEDLQNDVDVGELRGYADDGELHDNAGGLRAGYRMTPRWRAAKRYRRIVA